MFSSDFLSLQPHGKMCSVFPISEAASGLHKYSERIVAYFSSYNKSILCLCPPNHLEKLFEQDGGKTSRLAAQCSDLVSEGLVWRKPKLCIAIVPLSITYICRCHMQSALNTLKLYFNSVSNAMWWFGPTNPLPILEGIVLPHMTQSYPIQSNPLIALQ